MFHDQKLEIILQYLEEKPYWRSKELAEKLGISRSTVQRCTQELHDAGLVERIHGGIRRRDLALPTPSPVSERMTMDRRAKEKICAAAIRMLPREGYVYVDAGTTTLPLTDLLGNVRNNEATFVTNDITIAAKLSKKQICHILVGGIIHPVTQSISGAISQNQVMDYNFEMCLMSVESICPDGRVVASTADEASLKRQVLKHSKKKVLLAAESKWEHGSGVLIANLDTFDCWIIEKSHPAIESTCEKFNVELLIA